MEGLQKLVIKFWEKYMQPVDLMTFVVLIELVKGCYMISLGTFYDVDFTSYTEQSAQFLEGERDLSKIVGKNGPCLYPALHVYVFAAVYALVGVNDFIRYAQIFMLVIHIVTCIFAVKIYAIAFGYGSKNSWLVALCCLGTKVILNSVRISYAEEINIMIVMIAIYMFQLQSNLFGSVFIAIAMGFKMSVLLFIPGVYYIISKSQGIIVGTLYIIFIFMMQEVWAIPFTNQYGEEYRTTAFKFDRRFSIMGSINFHWLMYSPLFHSKFIAICLLILQLILLLYVLFKRWLPLLDENHRFSFRNIFRELGVWPIKICKTYTPQDPYLVAEVMFICNFIGCVCSRTLHQQFLVWYWFSIPLMMYAPVQQELISKRKLVISMIILNFAFSIVPSAPVSFTAFVTNVCYMILILKSDTPINLENDGHYESFQLPK